LKNPTIRYIFVEEMDTRGSNLGSWQMHPRQSGSTWVDPVAMWHNKKSTLGFADGHAEMHEWRDNSFIEWNLTAMYRPASFGFSMNPPADERTDIEYMAKGFPYLRLK
jgi:prepilin-type processing-associated H-X9-DG protein